MPGYQSHQPVNKSPLSYLLNLQHLTLAAPLFVIFTGANDLFFNPNISGLQTAGVIFTSITRLQNADASKFLLLGHPDLSLIPYDVYADATTKEALWTYTLELAITIEELNVAIPGSTVRDLASLFRHFYYYGEPKSYGFDGFGAYGSCLTGTYGEMANVTLCIDPEERVFR